MQICGMGIILSGSSLAIWPDKKMVIPSRLLLPGILFGVLSAFGQAPGAVVTRKANAMNLLMHVEINGMTAAYQRLLGALFAAFLLFALAAFFTAPATPARPSASTPIEKPRRGLFSTRFWG